jgi:hypothetical protein
VQIRENSGLLEKIVVKLCKGYLWNQDLKFPDVERAERLKAKETKKASNPFTAAKRKKKQIDEEYQSKDDDKVTLNHDIPEYVAPLAESCAGMAG